MLTIHRKLFLAVKKVQMIKISITQAPITPQKNIPSAIFLIPPTPYCYLENPAMYIDEFSVVIAWLLSKCLSSSGWKW